MAEQVVSNKTTNHLSLSSHYEYAREQVQIFKNYHLTYGNTPQNCSYKFARALDRGLFERHRNYMFKVETHVGKNNQVNKDHFYNRKYQDTYRNCRQNMVDE